MKYMRTFFSALFLLLSLPFLLGSCSDYEELSSITLDELHPVLVAPAVDDSLSVEDLVLRAGGTTLFAYDDDDLLYAESVVEHQLAALSSISPFKRKSDDAIISDTARFRFKLSELESVVAKRSVEVPISFFEPHISLSGVSLTAKAATYSIRAVVNNSAVPADIAFTMKIYSHPYPQGANTSFLEYREKTPLPCGEWSRERSELGTSGIALDKSTHMSWPDILLFNFENLGLLNPSSYAFQPTDEVEFFFVVQLHEVELSEAISAQSIPPKTVDVGVPPLSMSNDLFKSTLFAKQELPDVSIVLDAYDLPDGVGSLSFNIPSGGVQALAKTKVEDSIIVSTRREEGALLISDSEDNVIPAGTDTARFVLNAANSNLGDAFKAAPHTIKVENLTVKYSSEAIPAGVDVLPLVGAGVATGGGVSVPKFRIRTRVPFHGSVATNKMLSYLTVSSNAFPVPDAIIGDDNVELDGSNASIELGFVFRNRLPFNVFAQLDFVGEDKSRVIESLKLESATDSQVDGAEGLRLFINTASINDDGTVKEPVITILTTHVTREQYERISKEAKYLRQTYIFKTPEERMVKVKKGDYLGLRLTVRSAVNLSFK